MELGWTAPNIMYSTKLLGKLFRSCRYRVCINYDYSLWTTIIPDRDIYLPVLEVACLAAR